MSERCDLSDLLVEQCGCRVHAPQVSTSIPTGTVVSAKYPGLCTEGSDDIKPGELIAMTEDGTWVHVGCVR